MLLVVPQMVLWKPWKFGYHKQAHKGPCQASETKLFDGNISWLKVVNYFCKNISILDAWQCPKYASGRRMKMARYINL